MIAPKNKAEEDFVTIVNAFSAEHGVTLGFMRDVIAEKIAAVRDPLAGDLPTENLSPFAQEQIENRKARIVANGEPTMFTIEGARLPKSMKAKKAKRK